MYKGWYIYKELNLYLYNNSQSFLLAEIAEVSNKAENKKVLKKLESISYDKITTINEHFDCTILNIEKLKSYNRNDKNLYCLLTKDTLQFLLRIPLENALPLLCQSEMNDGLIKQQVMIARNKKGLCLLHEDMTELEIATSDTELRNLVKHKTINQKIGRNYFSLSSDSIYMGDIYQWYDILPSHIPSTPTTKYLQLKVHPKKVKIFVPTEYALLLLNGSRYISDFIYNAIDYFNGDSIPELPKTSLCDIGEKQVPRTEGNIQLINDATEKDWQLFINAKHEFFKKKCLESHWLIPVDTFLYSAFNDRLPFLISKEEKKNLKDRDSTRYIFI